MKWTKRDCLLIVQHMYFFPRYIITFASTSSTSVFQCIEAYFLNWITSIFCNEITWQYRYNYQLPHERGFFFVFCFCFCTFTATQEMAINSNTDKKLKNDFMNFVVKTEIKKQELSAAILWTQLTFSKSFNQRTNYHKDWNKSRTPRLLMRGRGVWLSASQHFFLFQRMTVASARYI